MFVDKSLTLQVIGSLMKKPAILADIDNYFLMQDDFPSLFEQNIFVAIFNLYQNGANNISTVDIDNYLKALPGEYSIFTRENGIEYLNDCEELSKVENFDYYYNRLKKLNCLRDLNKLGYSTEKIFSQEITEKAKKINEAFESLSVSDIIEICKKDIALVEGKYLNKKNNILASAADGIDDLVEQLRMNPDFGSNLPGDILNTIVRGARKGKFYIKSAESGVGKTRGLVGDACYLSYPIRYDGLSQQWIQDGSNDVSLYIVTEQEVSEIQTLIIANLSGVDEEKLIYNTYNSDEAERIKKAILLIKKNEKKFYIAKMPNPTIGQIKALVRKYYFENNIDNLFYDYIFSSPGLLGEFRDLKIREDVILCMLSTSLKDLAVELDLFISTSTQLNRGDENSKGKIRNQNNLRGAISIADKADVAYIFDHPEPEELDKVAPFIAKTGGFTPNQVLDLYKVRRSKLTGVRIWSFFDYGTCRKQDLFITKSDFNKVDNFIAIKFFDKNDKNYNELLEEINNEINHQEQEQTQELIEKIEEKIITKTLEKPEPKNEEEVNYF